MQEALTPKPDLSNIPSNRFSVDFASSEEQEIYFEIVYLLESIEDPEGCYFYD